VGLFVWGGLATRPYAPLPPGEGEF
jgi:hypothetical protein